MFIAGLLLQLLKENKYKIKSDSNLYNYLGIRSLYEGNFEDGWKYYEYRGSKLNSRFSDEVEWNGEKLDNKSIDNLNLDLSIWFFTLGIILFSGSLYLLAITSLKWLGAITPIGGFFFILGWMFLFLKSLKI